MSQIERRDKGLFIVPLVVGLMILAAGYLVSGSRQHFESNENNARPSDATAQDKPVERQEVGKNTQVDSVQKVKDTLIVLPAEHGGGFLADNIVYEYGHDEWDDIAKIPGIRAVWSRGFGTDAWETLGKLSDLECLDNRFFTITNEDLKCLTKLEKLEVLVLHTDVSSSQPKAYYGRKLPYSAVALEPLENMVHLRQLELSSDRLLDDGLAQVKAVPHLLSLTLTGHFTNEGLKHLSEMPEIRRLSLTGHFDDEGLIHLAKLNTLETLALSSDRLTGRGLAHLAKLPNLRHLIFRNPQKGTTLASLQELASLEVLHLGDDRLTDEMLSTLPHSNRIKSLSLWGAHKLTDEGLTHLLRLPELEELNLLHTRITPEGWKLVSSLRELRILLPDSIRASAKELEHGLAYLSRLPNLEALDLRSVGLEGMDVRVLNIPTLRKLNVDGHRVPAEIKQLRELIPELDPVTTELITIRADIIRDSSFWSFDFLTDQMEVEIE